MCVIVMVYIQAICYTLLLFFQNCLVALCLKLCLFVSGISNLWVLTLFQLLELGSVFSWPQHLFQGGASDRGLANEL